MKATFSHKRPLENASDGEPTNRANLSGREPEGPFAARMFGENAQHSLDGAQDGAMDDDGPLPVLDSVTRFRRLAPAIIGRKIDSMTRGRDRVRRKG